MRMEYFDIFVVTQLRAADAVSLALSCTQGRHLSAVKQRQLRIAISTTDLDNMKWCWIHPPADQCEIDSVERLGVHARLVLRAENCNVYRSYRSLRNIPILEIPYMKQQGTYLMTDTTSRIKWIGSGHGRSGWLSGLESEQWVNAKLDTAVATSVRDGSQWIGLL